MRAAKVGTVLTATAGSWQGRGVPSGVTDRPVADQHAADPQASATARLLLRILVARLAGIAPTDVTVLARCGRCGSREHGRPMLADGRYYVSLAHAGRWVAAAVSTAGPVGVDVERNAATGFPGFAEVALSPGETATSDVTRAIAWTRKEAILKATGQGLAIPPTRLTVSAAAESASLLDWRGPGRPRRPVRLFDLSVAADYSGAIAVLTDRRVVLHTLDGDALLRQETPAILPRTATR